LEGWKVKNQTSIEQALQTLKDNGLKYTKKREAMIAYLAKANRYVPAKELHEYMSIDYRFVPWIFFKTNYLVVQLKVTVLKFLVAVKIVNLCK
jgi:hypothetical protein